MTKKEYSILSLPVIVGALGFFVDIYDLLVFSIVRIRSLEDLGIPKNQQKEIFENMVSWQMFGLVIGGILWGMLGDKKGRKSVLFGSILIYSLATIANSFVTNVSTYTLLRFIAGLGLAGELGASITLTSEILPKEKRGLAASIIATCGVLGTITAYIVFANTNGNWKLCYQIGGAMGLCLLLLRVKVLDSKMYDSAKTSHLQMGNFLMFFNNKKRFITYIKCIAIGMPVWFVIGVLINQSNEFATRFNILDFDAPKALMLQYVGLAFGDMSAGILSNVFKSRKKVLLFFYALLFVIINCFFYFKGGGNSFNMYIFCILLGFASGISVLYITMSAENFGTNLRATAAISIPNLVRGTLVLIIFLFKFLRGNTLLSFKDNFVPAAWIVGIIILALGLWAAIKTKETFASDMDFLEV
ncbi:MAG: MFS transporter [Bacteroidetes bacterium]|nr:MFS transporter [Bacteroidota bacterium]